MGSRFARRVRRARRRGPPIPRHVLLLLALGALLAMWLVRHGAERAGPHHHRHGHVGDAPGAGLRA